MPKPSALAEVSAAFLRLGVISFGGPVAHLGYFRAEFVARRRWLDDEAYADLVALCQFLPGPASSQVAFALGMRRAGLPGAITASVLFLIPSAAIMIVFAYGIAAMDSLRDAGWLHGFKLAAVAVVAQAVWSMGRTLCPDRARLTLALLAAAAVLAAPGALGQVGAIAVGAALGWLIYRGVAPADSDVPRKAAAAPEPTARARRAGALALVAFAAILIASPVLASATGSRTIAVFDSFYRSGSLVFGGGHVVLPLLRAEVVPRGWITDDAFLAGYGAAQALPGPLFCFAGYLGAVIQGGTRAWLGGVWCLLAIFLPAWLLIGGALPFWHSLRTKAWAQAALKGANAAVVGVLLAALYTPVSTEALRGPSDVAAALLAFGLLQYWKAPPWAVVLLMAATGEWPLNTVQ